LVGQDQKTIANLPNLWNNIAIQKFCWGSSEGFSTMKRQLWFILGLLSMAAVLLISNIQPGQATYSLPDFKPSAPIRLAKTGSYSGIPIIGCTAKPKENPPVPHIETSFVPGTLTLDRFRKVDLQGQLTSATPGIANKMQTFRPVEKVALANPTNFGERYLSDINGQPVNHEPIIVLHETVSSIWSALNTFQAYQPIEDNQASYHTLIKLDGTIYYIVPPDKRAFGAGNSVFAGTRGTEAVQTNRKFSASVNNFAYHISFETPADGRGNGRTHSGYTNAQYRSLAWLVSKTGVPESRITTHKAVDRSRSRMDPRSFDDAKFLALLRQLPKTQEIAIGCPATPTKSI
jgi:hypothetical protein